MGSIAMISMARIVKTIREHKQNAPLLTPRTVTSEQMDPQTFPQTNRCSASNTLL